MAKHWIQKMDMKKGALRKAAKSRGGISKESGDIKVGWLDKAAKGKFGPTIERRAELAKTLRKLRKK